MRGSKAKALRRQARAIGPNSTQRIYRHYYEKPKKGVIELDENCQRGIYQRLKREVKRGQ